MPDSLPVTQETRERLRSQANQLGEADVLRLSTCSHLAVDDARQGGDPRLPLELALVKVTRPGADLSRESTALPARPARVRAAHGEAPPLPRLRRRRPSRRRRQPTPAPPRRRRPRARRSTSTELQAAWKQSILPAVQERSIPPGSVLAEAKPVELEDDRLVVEFPQAASFHRTLAEKPENEASSPTSSQR